MPVAEAVERGSNAATAVLRMDECAIDVDRAPIALHPDPFDMRCRLVGEPRVRHEAAVVQCPVADLAALERGARRFLGEFEPGIGAMRYEFFGRENAEFEPVRQERRRGRERPGEDPEDRDAEATEEAWHDGLHRILTRANSMNEVGLP